MNMRKIITKIVLIVTSTIVITTQADGQRRDGSMRENAPLVVVEPVTRQIMNDRLTAIGTGQAQSSVVLTPWSSGKLEHYHVQAGDYVKAGDAIAELDKDNEEIMVERARVEVEDAQETLSRLIQLRDSDTASRVQVINAELALSRAKLALQDGELALKRRTLRAPIDGIIGILPVDAGNYVTANTALARIDNRDKILIDVWLPERFAPQIMPNQEVQAHAVVRRDEIFTGRVSAIDNALDEASRTLRVRVEVINSQDKLQAGMSFAVTFIFSGDKFASVDPLAIQWSNEGAYVWRIDTQSKAAKVPLTIIQRNSDNVLVAGGLQEGDNVVVQGVHNIRQDMPVTIKQPATMPLIVPATDAVSSIRQN